MGKNNINNNTLKLIKEVGGAKVIQDFIISKGHDIKIDSIYKWKNNGIPHRYRSLINELKILRKNNKNIEPIVEISNSKIEKKYGYKNFNSILVKVFLIIIIITLILINNNYNNNYKNLNIQISNLKKEIYILKNNNANNYDKTLKKLNNQLGINSNLSSNNAKNIKELINLYALHEKQFNEIGNNTKNNYNVQNINNNKNYINTLFYLFWIQESLYLNLNKIEKLPSILEFLNSYKLPIEIKNSVIVLENMSKLKILSNNEIMFRIERILLNNDNIDNTDDGNPNITFIRKIKELIKITKVKNINKTSLINKINKSLINKDYIDTINLISSNNITPSSEELGDLITEIKKINQLDEALNKIIIWMINKG